MMPIGMFPGAITEVDPYESAIATDWLGVSHVIPIHFDTETQTNYLEWYKKELYKRNPDAKVIYLEAGVKYFISKGNNNNIIVEK